MIEFGGASLILSHAYDWLVARICKLVSFSTIGYNLNG